MWRTGGRRADKVKIVFLNCTLQLFVKVAVVLNQVASGAVRAEAA